MPERIRSGATYLDLQGTSPQPVVETIVKSLDMSSTMIHIHTYGTDNSRNKISIDFKRFVLMSTAINKMLGIRSDDVLYNPLPMYQSYMAVSGSSIKFESINLVGVGQMLLFGTTMVMKTYFLRDDFFSDCQLFGVTVAQYSAEMINHIYYVSSDTVKDHKIRMMIGSGMGRLLWNDFQKRFNIKKIGEFHSSIEESTYLINFNNKEGASGFTPWFVKGIHPVDIIDFDRDSGAPLRDENGLCIRTKSKGLLVGEIQSGADTSKSENSIDKTKQVSTIENVFKKGDKYFVSGEVFEKDDYGYFYFVDSVKNIFRWKGEDISRSQVTNIILKELGIDPYVIAVYGVKVGTAEGRAAMVALQIEDIKLDKARLMNAFQTILSSNQTPKFLRITEAIPKDDFYGISMEILEQIGFDPSAKWKKPDILYYYKQNGNKPYYDNLTVDVFNSIKAGNIMV